MCRIGISSQTRGFTLIELLVALMLFSIAAVIMMAWIPDITDRMVLERVTRQIEGTLSAAADRARTTGKDQFVTFAVGAGGMSLAVEGGEVIALDPHVEIKLTSAREADASEAHGAIAFLATGGSSGGEIDLRRGAFSARIEIDWLTGRARHDDDS
jgi:general secretion pathway protein H